MLRATLMLGGIYHGERRPKAISIDFNEEAKLLQMHIFHSRARYHEVQSHYVENVSHCLSNWKHSPGV